MEYNSNQGKLKDEKPVETINKIRNILKKMDIFITEKWYESVEGILSVTLQSEGTRLMTNGKGTSKKYALASGYGEFVERLQNGALYRYKVKMNPEDEKHAGFVYAPDEKTISIDELLYTDQKVILDSMVNKNSKSKLEMLNEWARIQEHSANSDEITALPFYSLNNDTTEYLPISILDYKYGTNGMCAGNTPEEAIVQGLSEILERYVNFRIIDENIVPPTISDDHLSQYPTLLELKDKVVSSGPFKVILKDCSLSQGLPVVALILINTDKSSYFVKFAAHPHFAIAIERSLTELLQGRNIHNMRGMTQFRIGKNDPKNEENKLRIAATGDGVYPSAIFREKSTYPLSENILKSVPDSITNSQMLKSIISTIRTMGHDILIRDVSFLGFPSYYLIVPGMSEITKDNDFAIMKATDKKFIAKIVENVRGASESELEEILSKMDAKGWTSSSIMSHAIFVKMNKEFSWNKLHYGVFRSCVLIKLGKYEEAILTLSNYILFLESNGIKQSKLNYYRCIINILESLVEGNSLEESLETISKFYSPALIKDTFNVVNEPFEYLMPFTCFNCENCSYQEECCYDVLSDFHRKWKDKYRINSIDQYENSKSFVAN